MSKNTVNDFWNRVDKVSNPNGCWDWTAGLDKKGYGYFWFNNKMIKSHRFSAELAGMNIDGLFVCHHCDNPKCVNPQHFFIGTNLDNMRDMFAKGRRPDVRKLGEDHGMAKLSEVDVRYIRANCKNDRKEFQKYALIYKVHPDTIANVVRNNTWRHI